MPSNYNPQTRQYSSIWDGTFKPAYSNNMAWCLWDMLTHPRYGMGKRMVPRIWINGRCIIGQYCDQSCRTALAARSRASPVMLT
ncbi:hypothetical protein ACLB1E_25400 [Escherichia coli]